MVAQGQTLGYRMTSTAKKGYSKEKLARDLLKAQGWQIMFKSIRWRFGTFDFGELFDIVAYKGTTEWVQAGVFPAGVYRKYISVKHLGDSNRYLAHQNAISEFQDRFGLEGESYELWLWDKPRWKGRGTNKTWHKGGFEVIIL
jgi:hypothetical protein